MRIMTIALGTALVLCNLGTFSAAAHAQAQVVREPRERPTIRVPVFRTIPYWDYNIVPRYRYRPQDDRVDPIRPARGAGDTLWKSRGIYSGVELNRTQGYKRTPRRDRACITSRTGDR